MSLRDRPVRFSTLVQERTETVPVGFRREAENGVAGGAVRVQAGHALADAFLPYRAQAGLEQVMLDGAGTTWPP